MATLYPFEGISQTYSYALSRLDAGTVPTLLGGNFLFVRFAGDTPIIVYAGEAESVYDFLTTTNLWNEARAMHGATALYVHLHADPRSRKVEKPPMNDKERGRPSVAQRHRTKSAQL